MKALSLYKQWEVGEDVNLTPFTFHLFRAYQNGLTWEKEILEKTFPKLFKDEN